MRCYATPRHAAGSYGEPDGDELYILDRSVIIDYALDDGRWNTGNRGRRQDGPPPLSAQQQSMAAAALSAAAWSSVVGGRARCAGCLHCNRVLEW